MSNLYCHHFNQNECRSCFFIQTNYSEQLVVKQHRCAQQLPQIAEEQWLPIFPSPEVGFRNKAKMVVSGSWQSPELGIVSPSGQPVDLTDCPLYPVAMQTVFLPIRDWITHCQLTPYDIQARSGELKFVLLSWSEQTGELMCRFVVRSSVVIEIMRSALPQLLAVVPLLKVVSVNIQPVPMAIVEGQEEVLLTEQSSLTMVLNDIPLIIRPKSFFQTNDAVAAGLYRQAQHWISEIQPLRLWDLFCGVGGFALHAAQVMQGEVIGIEISQEAIESAEQTARNLGLTQVRFQSLAADQFALTQSEWPDMVVVNPPRRGIGAQLSAIIEQENAIEWLIYSSCNPVTLAKDLAAMPSFGVNQAQVFDMFPHTEHAEVLVLLKRG